MREKLLMMQLLTAVKMDEYKYDSLRTIVSRENKRGDGEWSVYTAKDGGLYAVRFR